MITLIHILTIKKTNKRVLNKKSLTSMMKTMTIIMDIVMEVMVKNISININQVKKIMQS
jgi:hypothetical protein